MLHCSKIKCEADVRDILFIVAFHAPAKFQVSSATLQISLSFFFPTVVVLQQEFCDFKSSCSVFVWGLGVLHARRGFSRYYGRTEPTEKSTHVVLTVTPAVRCDWECDWLTVSFVSVWHGDGVVTCPGCTQPLTQNKYAPKSMQPCTKSW